MKVKVNVSTLPAGLGRPEDWVEIEIRNFLEKALLSGSRAVEMANAVEIVMDEKLPDQAFHIDGLASYARCEKLVITRQGEFFWRSWYRSTGIAWETDRIPLLALLSDEDEIDLRKPI